MKVDKIRKIVKLKRVVQRWKSNGLRLRSSEADLGLVQSGYLAVYVGLERTRFVIPTRFLKLRVFLGLLNQAEEEFGFPCDGGLLLPCDAAFFHQVLSLLERDEPRFGRLGLEEFLRVAKSEPGFESESSCRQATASEPSAQKARFETHLVSTF